MIFVNFKTYQEGSGERGVSLVKILEEVSASSGVKIIPVVQASDVLEIVQMTRLEVWVQHVDPLDPGAHTGSVLAQAVLEDGALGTFLNHSEKKFVDFESLREASVKAKAAGLKTLIFAASIVELEKILSLSPTFASYEPPELVGSAETSVAKEEPQVISQAVEICNKVGTPLIVGAGIKDMEDVKKSIELGAAGVAVASGVVASGDPQSAVMRLVEGFK